MVNDCIDVCISFNAFVFHQNYLQVHKLLDSQSFQGQNFALYLIIVAATTPSDGSGTYSPNNFSLWLQMAQERAKGETISMFLIIDYRP